MKFPLTGWRSVDAPSRIEDVPGSIPSLAFLFSSYTLNFCSFLNEPDPGDIRGGGGCRPNASYGELENFVLLILRFATSFPEPVYLFVSQLKT